MTNEIRLAIMTYVRRKEHGDMIWEVITMTLKELWFVSPQSFVFIKERNSAAGADSLTEYKGGVNYADRQVSQVTAKAYPCYKSVLEVELV